MARTMRTALLILPLLMMATACRFAEQQKDLAARVAAYSVLRPLLRMQSDKAPLTQSTARQTEAVAARKPVKSAIAPVAPVAPVEEASVQELRFGKKLPVAVAPVIAFNRHPIRMEISTEDIRRIEKASMAEVHKAMAVARCELQMERAKQQTRPRRRVIVLAPKADLGLQVITIGG